MSNNIKQPGSECKPQNWNSGIVDASRPKAPAGELSIIQLRLNNPFLQANGLRVTSSGSRELRRSAIKPVCTGNDCRSRGIEKCSKCGFACSVETREKEGLHGRGDRFKGTRTSTECQWGLLKSTLTAQVEFCMHSFYVT